MAKIKFDSSYLKKEVCPGVNDTMSTLDSAYYWASFITNYNVPTDFRYRYSVSRYDSRISSCKQKLSKFGPWVDTCEKVYSGIVSDQEERIKAIEDVAIAKREKKI